MPLTTGTGPGYAFSPMAESRRYRFIRWRNRQAAIEGPANAIESREADPALERLPCERLGTICAGGECAACSGALFIGS